MHFQLVVSLLYFFSIFAFRKTRNVCHRVGKHRATLQLGQAFSIGLGQKALYLMTSCVRKDVGSCWATLGSSDNFHLWNNQSFPLPPSHKKNNRTDTKNDFFTIENDTSLHIYQCVCTLSRWLKKKKKRREKNRSNDRLIFSDKTFRFFLDLNFILFEILNCVGWIKFLDQSDL